ncbi:MAG: N-acetylmuramoyl-L-alanine amidase, partial [Actinomycetaceae bacterium]|nr:N-acetylmuramoyl-L-alanine amidase [Actinomycetaceae bacterium]
YQVDSNGRIGQLVWDRDTAWHAGNWEANCTSIGIEHANNHVGNPWTISDATLENGAHLVAALCRYYKLGRPQWGKNVFGHKHFAATSCPGEIAGSQNSKYMTRAQYWYDHMTSGKTPAPTAKSASTPSTDIDALADAVIRGEYGNGGERKQRLGANYTAVQKRVNEKLSGAAPAKPDGPNIDALADAVIRGEYGNGDERKQRLGNLYSAVQARVNQKLG